MDIQQLILEEIKATRAELHIHIKEGDIEIAKVRSDINELNTQARLVNQRSKFVNGAIATIIAGVVTWLANVFGFRSS